MLTGIGLDHSAAVDGELGGVIVPSEAVVGLTAPEPPPRDVPLCLDAPRDLLLHPSKRVAGPRGGPDLPWLPSRLLSSVRPLVMPRDLAESYHGSILPPRCETVLDYLDVEDSKATPRAVEADHDAPVVLRPGRLAARVASLLSHQ